MRHVDENIAAVNGAIEAVVPALALELGPTRVNAISPGTLATSYWRGVPEEIGIVGSTTGHARAPGNCHPALPCRNSTTTGRSVASATLGA
jgi:NAD(P)-dependent dehydrogenase (short-subunit alcohol dehydrogenase family)